MRRRVVRWAAVLWVAAGLAASAATASPSLRVGIYDDGQSLFNGATAFPTYRQLGVQVLRVTMFWGGPNGVSRRPPVDGTDPADASYDWSLYDAVVQRAQLTGIKVVFSLYGTPRWANRKAGLNRVPSNMTYLRAFVFAAATRYSGTYTPDNSQLAVPAVRNWLAWNEPNNPVFLKPQFRKVGSKTIYQSAIDYRRICDAVYTGVHSTMLKGEKVACGVTAPRGNNDPSSVRPSTSPLAFLRALKKAGLQKFDAYAHHPYYGNPTETPTTAPRTSNGRPTTAVTLGNIGTLIAELTRLYGARRLWITEYGYQTSPPDPLFGVSWTLQAKYLTQAFGIARANPRIDMMLWFLLRDEPNVAGWQSGLFTTEGQKKPAFNAFERLSR